MVNYQQGKIYKIVCNITGNIYVGSTCKPKLSQRLSQHRASNKQYTNQKTTSYCTSFQILDNGNYDIILLENYPCETKDELTARERFHIESHDCVNKYIPGRTKAEYYDDNREHITKYMAEYRVNNRETIAEYNAEYYVNNRDNIINRQKLYDDAHKRQRNEYQRAYRAKRKYDSESKSSNSETDSN